MWNFRYFQTEMMLKLSVSPFWKVKLKWNCVSEPLCSAPVSAALCQVLLDSTTPAPSSALGEHNLPSLNMDLGWGTKPSLRVGQRRDGGLQLSAGMGPWQVLLMCILLTVQEVVRRRVAALPSAVWSLGLVLYAVQCAPSRTTAASRASSSIALLNDPLLLQQHHRESSGHTGAPRTGNSQIKTTSPKQNMKKERD